MGGAISDLVSRVNILESSLRNTTKPELDWTKYRNLYYKNGDGLESVFPPQGYTRTPTGLSFTFDRKALVLMHVASRKDEGDALIRINTVTCCWAASGSGYDISVMIVKPGDTCEVVNANINDSMTIREIPFMSIL